MITIQADDLKVPTHYFVEQLRQKWPTAKIHFISDPNAHSELQWSVELDEESFVLGDFSADGISFQGGGSRANIAKLALWYRSLVPYQYKMLLYKDSLSHKPIKLVEETSLEDIINGFDIPFDPTIFNE